MVKYASDVTTYQYYDNGNCASVTYSNGFKEEYAYYPNNQIKSLINSKADGSVMDSYNYTYDNAGNQLTKNETIKGVVKGITTYTYDTLNRLLTVKEPSGRLTTYTYDKAGNRLTESIVIGSTTTLNTYAYNDQNRLTDVTTMVNNVITEVTGYSYDNNGNQLTTVVKTYTSGVVSSTETKYTNTYDVHNQLISTIAADGTEVINTYNSEGYRVGKKVNNEQTYYLYEADKVVLELNADGQQIGRNIYGINLILRTVGNDAYYYLYNGHADVTALITASGVIGSSYYYDAFGNILEETGDINNSILYAGYQFDDGNHRQIVLKAV